MRPHSSIPRRQFIKQLVSGAIGGAALFSGAGLSNWGQGQPTAAKPPNILFIAVDDLRTQLGCYGHQEIISPHIDKLAASGMVFERAYCQQAVCTPSRVSLLSGLRPDTTGIYGIKTRLRQVLPQHITLPRHFKQKGYETVSIGKIYHHPDDDPQGWSSPPIRFQTPDKLYCTPAARKLKKEHEQTHPTARYHFGPPTETADLPDNAYSDGQNTDAAITGLERLAKKQQPFFLGVGYHKPHLPFTAPAKYWNLYDPAKISLAANPYPAKGAPVFSMTNYGELRNYVGVPKGKQPIPDTLARHLIHGYYACVSYIDAQVGRLLQALDKFDLTRNTIVILWGDHGWKLGEHGSWCKHTNCELDTRAPLIIRAPGMKAIGRHTTALTEFVDIYPTLCDLCGIDRPQKLQHPLEGTSFAALLDHPQLEWKQAAFSQYPRGSLKKKDKTIMGYAMRTQRYRYIEWKYLASSTVLARECYDHDSDPGENTNIIDAPRYAQTVQQLAQMMKAGWKAARPRAATANPKIK